MPAFKKRSYQKELLDRDDIPFPDILRNMEELNTINTWLGGHKISCDGIKKIFATGNHLNTSKKIVICEIGCGSGNNLLAIKKWCSANNVNASFIGIDINPKCIESAPQAMHKDLELIVNDYRDMRFKEPPDIIFSSLFCHHFTDEELVEQLQWMKTNAGTGFFINDLHRHPLAYYSIKTLTRLFSKSYLVKNDAPVSVLRGFKRNELEALLKKAGLGNCSIEWKWAFRWLITYPQS
jgi:2-polyprenyl-3-methyl-5-hydroxy-6-metoxy-1,4-benzoquinol methylase